MTLACLVFRFAMAGGVGAHEIFLNVTHAYPLIHAGVECEHSTRSSFIHACMHSLVAQVLQAAQTLVQLQHQP
jgi:hypothetical protein